MKKKLNLKPLLFLRSVREKEAQAESIRKRQALEVEQRKLEKLAEAFGEHRDRLDERKKLHPAELKEHQRYLHLLRRQIKDQKKKVEQREQEFREARSALMDRAKERKVIEKLEEKLVAEQRVAVAKREQNEADEVAVIRYESPEEKKDPEDT